MAELPGELGGNAGTPNIAPTGISGLKTTDFEVMGGTDKDVDPKFTTRPSQLPTDQLYTVLKGWWRADSEHSNPWRQNCKEWYQFRVGDQWAPEDRQLLSAQQRPIIVFNRLLTILKAVAGMEINGRHEVTFLPRNTQDTAINEVLHAGSKWMGDQCDAEDEESAAFEDCCTCGMGWTESRLDYELDWKGEYVQERISPFEMFWDRTAFKKNLADARRLSRVRKMPLGDAMALFPGKTKEQLDAVWAVENIYGATKTLEEKRRREQNTTESQYDDTLEVTIVHMQWFEREYYWKVANIQDSTVTDLSEDAYHKLQERLHMLGAPHDIQAVKLPRRIYKQAFMGSQILEMTDSPVKDQFTWKCITGEADLINKTWFGLVQLMQDPQRWANKWLSQVLHILNTTAKGGIIAEEDAFAGDIREVEDKYARPDTITWAAKGAISGQKLMPKPGGGITEGHVKLLEFAISSLRDVSGINLELLGQQDQNQPGILEQYRKQAGMTILATLFDSLRRYRKEIGRLRLYYIQNYLADGRLIRVVGPEGAKAVPLAKDKCIGKYDVVIDDAPSSPNMKEQNWMIIQPMLAIFKDQLIANPLVLAALLEYSPLPNRVVEMIKQFAQQAAQDPDSQKDKELGRAVIASKAAMQQSTAMLNEAKAGATQTTAIYDIAMAKNLLEKGNVEGLKAHLESMGKAEELRQQRVQQVNDTATTAADLQKTRAETDETRASALHTVAQAHKTAAEARAAHASVAESDANANAAHAKAFRDRLGSIVDALSAHHEMTRPEPQRQSAE